MASNAGGSGRGSLPWRTIGWGSAVALLLLPFIAMQLGGTGVNWSLTDFIVFGVMLGSVGGAFEVAVRASGLPGRRSARPRRHVPGGVGEPCGRDRRRRA
jgi:hypothetical protein